MNTRSLTGNRDRAKGWTQDEETSNWTPSVYDRRRLAVSHMTLIAEANNLPGVPQPVALFSLAQHSVGEDDMAEMVKNFEKWLEGQQA